MVHSVLCTHSLKFYKLSCYSNLSKTKMLDWCNALTARYSWYTHKKHDDSFTKWHKSQLNSNVCVPKFRQQQQKHWIVALGIARNVLHFEMVSWSFCECVCVCERENVFEMMNTEKNGWKNFGYKTHWMRINVKCVSDKSILHIHSYMSYMFAITQLATALLLHLIAHHMQHSLEQRQFNANNISTKHFVAIFHSHQFVVHH